LGVGIGVGLPATIIAIIMLLMKCRGRREKPSAPTGIPMDYNPGYHGPHHHQTSNWGTINNIVNNIFH
jgi:hypothetical protein